MVTISAETAFWLSFEAFVAALQIAACLLVLRENSMASKIMLGGALLSVLARTVFYSAVLMGWAPTLPAFRWLPECAQAGTVIFFAGLLLHARRRRAMARRVEEFEQLLSTRTEV